MAKKINLAKTTKKTIKSGKSKVVKTSKSGSSTRKLSPEQRARAAENLARARQLKAEYKHWRNQGFTKEEIHDVQWTIFETINKNSVFEPERNPAVKQLFEDIGGRFKSEQEIKEMSSGEFYKYTSAIREFLNNPLSSEEAAEYLQGELTSQIVGYNLLQSENESRGEYLKRRREFIDKNEEMSKEAFRLYRAIESTNAGQILMQTAAKAAYGSDNLIVDIFSFMDSEYDGNFDAARDYWQQKLDDQYSENLRNLQTFNNAESIKFKKFDWRAGESYAQFTRRRESGLQ